MSCFFTKFYTFTILISKEIIFMSARKRSAHPKKSSFNKVLILIILIFSILISIILIQKQTQYTQHAATGLTHFFGGFGAENAISLAASLGVQAGLNYGYNPVPGRFKKQCF